MKNRRKKAPRPRADSTAAATPPESSHAAELTDDVFDALLQLGRLEEGELPSPELLRQRIRALMERVPKRAAEVGLSREDAKNIQYALVAFADDVALNCAPSISDYWQQNLLQMEYFDENTAGEGFFERLEAVRKSSDRLDVLLVYYFCLVLGFKGKYRVRGGDAELLEIVDSVAASLNRAGLKDPDALSPHVERGEEAAKEDRRRVSILLVPVAAAVLSLVAYLLFGRVQPEIDAAMATIDEIIRGGGG